MAGDGDNKLEQKPLRIPAGPAMQPPRVVKSTVVPSATKTGSSSGTSSTARTSTSIRHIHQAKFKSAEDYLVTVISEEVEKPVKEEAALARLLINKADKVITAEEGNRNRLRHELTKLLGSLISSGLPYLKTTKPGNEHSFTKENKVIGQIKTVAAKNTATKAFHSRLKQLSLLLAELNRFLYPNLSVDMDLCQTVVDLHDDPIRVKPEVVEAELLVVNHTPGGHKTVIAQGNAGEEATELAKEVPEERLKELITKYSLSLDQLLARSLGLDNHAESWATKHQEEIDKVFEDTVARPREALSNFIGLFENTDPKSITKSLRPRLLSLALRELVIEEIEKEKKNLAKKYTHIALEATKDGAIELKHWTEENPFKALFRGAITAVVVVLLGDRIGTRETKPVDTKGTNNIAINTNNPNGVPTPYQRPEEFKFKIVNKIANQLINTELGLNAPASIANQVIFRGERFDKAYLLVDRSGTFKDSLAGRSGTDDASKFIIKLGELLNKHYISSVKAADILVAFTDPLTPDLARKPAMIVKRNYNYNGVNKEYTVLVLSRELVATSSSMSKEQLAKVTDIVEAYMRADKLGALDTYRQDSDGNLDPAILADLKKLITN